MPFYTSIISVHSAKCIRSQSTSSQAHPESTNLLVRIGSQPSRLTVGSRTKATSPTPVTQLPPPIQFPADSGYGRRVTPRASNPTTSQRSRTPTLRDRPGWFDWGRPLTMSAPPETQSLLHTFAHNLTQFAQNVEIINQGNAALSKTSPTQSPSS